jgi:hypothetical protein
MIMVSFQESQGLAAVPPNSRRSLAGNYEAAYVDSTIGAAAAADAEPMLRVQHACHGETGRI